MKFSEYDKQNKKIKRDEKEPVWVENFDFDVCHLVSEARLREGLTQKQLADLVGTQQPSIARVENGSVLPGLSFLKRIALAIGTTLIPPKFGFMENVDVVSSSKSKTQKQAIPFTFFPGFPRGWYTRVDTNSGGVTNTLQTKEAGKLIHT